MCHSLWSLWFLSLGCFQVIFIFMSSSFEVIFVFNPPSPPRPKVSCWFGILLNKNRVNKGYSPSPFCVKMFFGSAWPARQTWLNEQNEQKIETRKGWLFWIFEISEIPLICLLKCRYLITRWSPWFAVLMAPCWPRIGNLWNYRNLIGGGGIICLFYQEK